MAERLHRLARPVPGLVFAALVLAGCGQGPANQSGDAAAGGAGANGGSAGGISGSVNASGSDSGDSAVGGSTPGGAAGSGGAGSWPGPVTKRRLTSGDSFSCAIIDTGQIACWGSPPPAPPAGTFKLVSGGGNDACAIATDDTLICFGPSYQGTAPSGSFTDVDTGWGHSCAVSAKAALSCWGDTADEVISMQPPGLQGVHVGIGISHGCLTNMTGSAKCWGFFADGMDPTPPSSDFVALYFGDSIETCGLKAGGSIACWNQFNRPVPTSAGWTQLALGSSHICALHQTGKVTCWGPNASAFNVPADAFSEISAGKEHMCGITVGGLIKCWGTSDATEATSPKGIKAF